MFIGAGHNRLGKVDDLCAGHHRDERGVLQQGDELVAQGGQNGLESWGTTMHRMVVR